MYFIAQPQNIPSPKLYKDIERSTTVMGNFNISRPKPLDQVGKKV